MEKQQPEFLVTGATGFLGFYVIKLLLLSGAKIRVFTRSERESFAMLGIRTYIGSLSDKNKLMKAAKGVDGIFHLAGMVIHNREKNSQDELYETNVQGTINVMNVAAAVKTRVVYASTSGAVACSADPNHIAGDYSPYCHSVVARWPYYTSKIEAEMRAREIAKEKGVDLVVLRPTMMIGPGDTLYRSTRIVIKYLNRRIPLILPGGVSIADVRDVALAFCRSMYQMLLHADRIEEMPKLLLKLSKDSTADPTKASFVNPVGQCYLLGSVNWTYNELFNALELASGVSKPLPITVPAPVLGALSKVLDSSYYKSIKNFSLKSITSPITGIFSSDISISNTQDADESPAASTPTSQSQYELNYTLSGTPIAVDTSKSDPSKVGVCKMSIPIDQEVTLPEKWTPPTTSPPGHFYAKPEGLTTSFIPGSFFYFGKAQKETIGGLTVEEEEKLHSSGIDAVSLEMASHFWYLDSSRASSELGFNPRDATVTIADTVRWIIDRRKASDDTRFSDPFFSLLQASNGVRISKLKSKL